MENTEYDAVIIGSGPGGYYCAERIAQLGGKVAIIEKDALGGCCTNWGCIPTKALHASASLFRDINDAAKMGIAVNGAQVDVEALVKRKERVVKTLSAGVGKIMKDHSVDVIMGKASIADKNTVQVNDQTLKTKHIVIATGATPRQLPNVHDNAAVVTSKQLIESNELPSSMIIIGGGYIGSEFASILGAMGTKVTVVEMLPHLVATEDKDISDHLEAVFKKQGINVLLETKVVEIKDNKVTIEDKEGKRSELEAEKILVSIGMVPTFDIQEMDNLGVKHEQGIVVNTKMQTSVDNIYAVGDVTATVMLAHHAYAQGEIAAKNIMGQDAELKSELVPSTIFTLPEIASVGVRNTSLQSVTYPFIVSGKARASGHYDGFIKLYHEGGMLRGFSSIGHNASDLVAEATLAIQHNISLQQIADTIHAHPTLPEAFQHAVRMALHQK